MKKIVKKIAVILILVMLANSFTSCATTKDLSDEEKYKSSQATGMLIGIPLGFLAASGLFYLLIDPITDEPPLKTYGAACAITGILAGVALVFIFFDWLGHAAVSEVDSNDGIYIAEIENEPFVDTVGSLMETEEIPAINTLNSLPENAMYNLLQKIEVGTNPDNSVYVGVRLKY